MKATIRTGNEYMQLHEDGAIERTTSDGFHVAPNASRWAVVGAVGLNNFGNIVERFSLADILAGKVSGWLHKNGKQRVHLVDFDHGAKRIWCNPTHEVYLVKS